MAPRQTAKGLAWFGIGLGLAKLLAPKAVAKASGLEGARVYCPCLVWSAQRVRGLLRDPRGTDIEVGAERGAEMLDHAPTITPPKSDCRVGLPLHAIIPLRESC